MDCVGWGSWQYEPLQNCTGQKSGSGSDRIYTNKKAKIPEGIIMRYIVITDPAERV